PFPTGWGSCEALRRLLMPVGLELIAMRHVENARLGEMRTHDLQTHGQSGDEAAGNRQRRQAREIRTDRVDVVEVHRDGIRSLRTDAKGWRRARGAHEDVDLGERALEIGRDELADALRLEIVGVVIARRQHVGACHDAALDLRTEALPTGAAVKVLQVARILAAVAEAHAIITGEVR